MEKRVSFSQFQKLGKVLMTPVMILPIAGILVGIGSAFTTKNIVALWPVLGNTYVKLFFNLLKAMGNTINSYLPIIFAVSVAIGYAEKEKGIAALSSVIGFLAMNNVMNILLTSLGILDPSAMKTGQSMVMGIASLDTGVFAMLDAFRANENGAAPLPLTANSDCNGYWKRLAGLELQG